MTNPEESSLNTVEAIEAPEGTEEATSETVDGAAEEDAPQASEAGDALDDSDEDGDSEPASDEEDDEDDEEGDDESSDAAGPSKAEQLDLETEIAADYLEELMDIADLDGDIDTYVEGGRPCVSIQGGSEKLVGKDGKVLDAIQELARLAVMTETGHRSRLMLDVSGYRDRRRKELEAIGHDAVAEVQETGSSVRLTPMNAFERKIVHDIVAAAGLVSESEGQEPQRRVVVQPK